MSEDVASAMRILQARMRSSESTNYEDAERCELALNELSRHPSRTGDPEVLVKKVLANARKHRRRRRAILRQEHLNPVNAGPAEVGWGEAGQVIRRPLPAGDLVRLSTTDAETHEHIAVCDAIERSSLSAFERRALVMLVEGCGSDDIAEAAGLPLPAVRVRLSRMRAKARDLDWGLAA